MPVVIFPNLRLSFFKENIVVSSQILFSIYLTYFQNLNFFTSFLNNLITNRSLFLDNSRKYNSIAFHYGLQQQSFKGIP